MSHEAYWKGKPMPYRIDYTENINFVKVNDFLYRIISTEFAALCNKCDRRTKVFAFKKNTYRWCFHFICQKCWVIDTPFVDEDLF